MIDKLIKVCENHILSASALAVVREPYFPFVPKGWNGVLVLVDSQYVSNDNDIYMDWLKNLSSCDKMKRLYLGKDSVGIQPWDDGTLKLAVESFNYNASETASERVKRLYLRDVLGVQLLNEGSLKLAVDCLNFNVRDTAVCNAVLWSQREQVDRTDNTNSNLQMFSANLWSKLLPVMQPTLVICCGKIAKDVIAATDLPGEILTLPLPSPSAVARVTSRFSEHNLLSRYPEVNDAVVKHPDLMGSTDRSKQIFYACNAVRIARVFKIKERMVQKSTIGREAELVRCLHCGRAVRHARIDDHINLKHSEHIETSALECRWIEKKCEQCGALIFIRHQWKCPNLRCRKCMEKWNAKMIVASKKLKFRTNPTIKEAQRVSKKRSCLANSAVNATTDSLRRYLETWEILWNRGKPPYSNLRGRPMQGGSPGLGKRR